MKIPKNKTKIDISKKQNKNQKMQKRETYPVNQLKQSSYTQNIFAFFLIFIRKKIKKSSKRIRKTIGKTTRT